MNDRTPALGPLDPTLKALSLRYCYCFHIVSSSFLVDIPFTNSLTDSCTVPHTMPGRKDDATMVEMLRAAREHAARTSCATDLLW